MISFIQSCSIDTTAYFSILTTIIIKVHKNNFQIIYLSQSHPSLALTPSIYVLPP